MRCAEGRTLARLARAEVRPLFARIKRDLYPDNRPGRLARWLNRGWAWLHAAGIAPNWLVTLEVRGRRSGRVISFPLVMAVVDDERYLVSMMGQGVAWVRNVEAADGHARLRHGRTEQVRLQPVDESLRPAILKAYLQRAPGARPHVPVSKDAPLADFEAIAAEIPVFRVRVETDAPGDQSSIGAPGHQSSVDAPGHQSSVAAPPSPPSSKPSR